MKDIAANFNKRAKKLGEKLNALVREFEDLEIDIEIFADAGIDETLAEEARAGRWEPEAMYRSFKKHIAPIFGGEENAIHWFNYLFATLVSMKKLEIVVNEDDPEDSFIEGDDNEAGIIPLILGTYDSSKSDVNFEGETTGISLTAFFEEANLFHNFRLLIGPPDEKPKKRE